MIVIVSISLIASILTLLDSRRILKNGMLYGFVLTTIFAALHYDYGNDYMPYFKAYQRLLIYGYSWSDVGVKGIVENNEYGWGIINMLFFPMGKYGFFGLVATLSIFEGYSYYHIIKRYVVRDWWWLAVCMYLFSTSIYIINFSLLRQGLVASAFVLLYPWIIERKVIKSILVILMLSTIHTSAFILLPFAFLGYLPSDKSGKFYGSLLLALLILFWMSSTILNSIFESISNLEQVEMYSEKYKNSANSYARFGAGFILNMIPFIIIVYYLLKAKLNKTLLGLVLLSGISYILIPMAIFIGSILGRISYYFSPFSIVSIPVTYSFIKNINLRLALLLLLLVFTIYNYIIFFSNPVWSEHFSTYHTIFEATL